MFEIYQTESNKEYRFRLKDSDGTILLTGEGYKAKANCKKGVESVGKNGTVETRYELKESSNGKFYYLLKATNGQVIGQTKMHASEGDAHDNKAAIMKHCTGKCTDLTVTA